MAIPLTLPFVPFSGTAGGLSLDVPGKYPIALGGTGYFIDWNARDRYQFRTLDLLRSQSDSGTAVGAQSINPEGLWRKTVDEWHLGAGQTDFDRASSSTQRFRSSKGIDPWERGQLSLLPDTTESLDSSSTNLKVLSANDRLYVADNQTLKYTADPFAGSPSYTSVTGTAAAAITAIASTGYRVMVAQGASGIYRTETDSSSATSWVTGTIDDVAYVKGRVLAASGTAIHEITAALDASADTLATHGTELLDHADSNFEWVGFAEGLNHIYAAGFSGDKSEIYRIEIKADGTGLTAPTVAGRLPDGEIISSIYGYLGFVLVGTTKGLRLAIADTNGNLTFGALIETGTNVRCWEGQGQYVWFGWETYDSVSSGLGRLDLATMSDESALVPAYASDLMVTAQAGILSVATHSSKRCLAVSGDGIYVQDTDLVSEGSIDSGLISFGLAEQKTAVNVKATADFSSGGTLTVSLCEDDQGFTALGATTMATKVTFDANETSGTRHEIRLKLDRSSTDSTKGPTIRSWMLQAFPRVAATQIVTIPILLRASVDGVSFDVEQERDAIESLWSERNLTTFQEGSRSHIGIVENFIWNAEDPITDLADYGQTQGTLTVQFKIIEGAA